MTKMPFKIKFWNRVNHYTARLAWKFANPGGEDWGKALRIDEDKLLWRLNRWVGDKWIPEYIEKRTGKKIPTEK